MSDANSLLPMGYEALEPFVETYAIDNAPRRAEMRGEAPTDVRDAFYEEAKPLLAQALEAVAIGIVTLAALSGTLLILGRLFVI